MSQGHSQGDSQGDNLRDSDRLFLLEAIRLAEGGRYTCAPNPCVGCLIVKDAQIIGRGFHARSGQGHAEVNAIADARAKGHDVANSTFYVSLEPCSFVGRTPACAATLIEAKVARVVVAMVDPFPQVAGTGLDMLRKAGIAVDVCELDEAQQLVRGYIKRVSQGMPLVRVKTASSLDGAVALANGESQWITGPDARRDVQRLRARSDAVITGIGTVLADNPSLTVREEDLAPFNQPLRVVLDRSLRTPANMHVVCDGRPTLIYHDDSIAVPEHLAASQQVECVGLPSAMMQDHTLQLKTILKDLATRGCNEVLVEAGPAVVGSVVQSGLWDEWVAYVAPKWLGAGAQSVALFDLHKLADAPGARLVEQSQVGDDLRLVLVRE